MTPTLEDKAPPLLPPLELRSVTALDRVWVVSFVLWLQVAESLCPVGQMWACAPNSLLCHVPLLSSFSVCRGVRSTRIRSAFTLSPHRAPGTHTPTQGMSVLISKLRGVCNMHCGSTVGVTVGRRGWSRPPKQTSLCHSHKWQLYHHMYLVKKGSGRIFEAIRCSHGCALQSGESQ